MGRVSVCQKTGLRKGSWTSEEDERLVICINIHGPSNWRELPKYAGLARCGKSCRLRWFNYLRPTTKRGNFSSEEDQLIRDLHEKLGNKWSKIAKELPGRTDNEIKNHWHTHLVKQITRSSKVKSKNIGYKEQRNTTNYLRNNLLHDNMTPSILESSSTISPTSPQNSTGYSSCTVDDKVGISKNQAMYEISSNQTSDIGESFYFEHFVFPTLPCPPPVSPLGEVIQSFCSSAARDDNDMFSSSSTVRNEVTGTMPWKGNMMDDGVTSPFVNNSLLPPLSPYTETFYPHAIYNCEDTKTAVNEALSEANFEQTAEVLSESFCMEDERFASSLQDFGFHYRLWE